MRDTDPCPNMRETKSSLYVQTRQKTTAVVPKKSELPRLSQLTFPRARRAAVEARLRGVRRRAGGFATTQQKPKSKEKRPRCNERWSGLWQTGGSWGGRSVPTSEPKEGQWTNHT